MLSGDRGRDGRRCAILALAAATLVAILMPAPAGAQVATIDSTKTVGLDPNACSPLAAIALPPEGGDVTYCYDLTNTGTVTFTSFSLVDSELGVLLLSFPYSLAPGASMVVTQSATLTATTTNVATWTAFITPTVTVTDTDSALVTVTDPTTGLLLVKTVGTDPNACASTASIVFPPGGGTAVYCYEVTNTGNVTLAIHDLVDDQLGALLSSFPYSLAPGASVFVTQAAIITETTFNSATWTASGGAFGQATDDGGAVVNVQERVNIPTLSPSALLLLALILCAAGLLAVRRLA